MAAFQRIEDDLPGRGGISRDHLGAIHGAEESGHKRKATRSIIKIVRHHIVGIGPDAVVRIVAEVAAVGSVAVGHGKRVADIGSRGVRAGRDRDALIENTGRRGRGELRNHPAIRQFVVEHDRIAGILGLARVPAKSRPESIDVGRARDRCGCVEGTIERPDLIARIDRLDVLIITDRAVVVGRETARSVYAFEIESGGGRRRRRRSSRTTHVIPGRWCHLSHRVRSIRARNAPRWQLRFLELLRGRLRNGKLGQLAQGRRDVELGGRDHVNGLAEPVRMLLHGAQRAGIERHLRGGIRGGGCAPHTAFCRARTHSDIFQGGGPFSVLSVGFRIKSGLLLRRHPRRGR